MDKRPAQIVAEGDERLREERDLSPELSAPFQSGANPAGFRLIPCNSASRLEFIFIGAKRNRVRRLESLKDADRLFAQALGAKSDLELQIERCFIMYFRELPDPKDTSGNIETGVLPLVKRHGSYGALLDVFAANHDIAVVYGDLADFTCWREYVRQEWETVDQDGRSVARKIGVVLSGWGL